MEKIVALRARLADLGRVVVSFSGGSDGFILLKLCAELLGKENVCGVFVDTVFVSDADRKYIVGLKESYPIEVIKLDILTPEICRNDENRCYECKKRLMREVSKFREKHGYKMIVDGCVCDDLTMNQQKITATDEFRVVHPFVECGVFRDDIKMLCIQSGICERDSMTRCLAKEVKTGEIISETALQKLTETVINESSDQLLSEVIAK